MIMASNRFRPILPAFSFPLSMRRSGAADFRGINPLIPLQTPANMVRYPVCARKAHSSKTTREHA